MIIRIVKMCFKEENISTFLEIFNNRKDHIRNFAGCRHLELWQDEKQPCIFFTYSIWETESNLNHYRFSQLFKNTWGLTKALFAEKAEAWTVRKV